MTNVSYEIAKFLHITGVVMLMGNITVTAIWKFFADRTQRPEVLAFAQKLVTYTDWSMTVWGVVLLMAGGNIINAYFDVAEDRINRPEIAIVGIEVGLLAEHHCCRVWGSRARWWTWSVGWLVARWCRRFPNSAK